MKLLTLHFSFFPCISSSSSVQPPLSGMNFLNQVDEEIWQLRNQLPPIDRKAILRQMKAERIAQTQVERQCMCQLVECSQEEAERACGGEWDKGDTLRVSVL